MTEYRDRFPFTDPGYARYNAATGFYDDGYQHQRDEYGWCINCDAPPKCSHVRLLPKPGSNGIGSKRNDG